MPDNRESAAGEKDANLGKQIRSMQDAVDNTLIEIQNLISDIENPFTLLGKLAKELGKDKIMKMENIDKDQPKEPEPQAIPPPQPAPLPNPPAAPSSPPKETEVEKVETIPANDPSPTSEPEKTVISIKEKETSAIPPLEIDDEPFLDLPERNEEDQLSQGGHLLSLKTLHFMDSIALAEFLLDIFGSADLFDILQTYVETDMVDEDAVKALMNAADLITKSGTVERSKPTRALDSDDHILAVYLIDIFSRDSAGLLYLLLHVLSLGEGKIDGPVYSDKEDLR